MALTHITLLLTLTASGLCQRPFYAGTRPIGYPQVETDGLGNRFGDGDNTTTTQRLPIEALGDRDLVDRLSKLPIDKQPFWLINWQALEAHRKNPQTYPQRPSQFAQPFDPQNPGTVNSHSASNSISTGSDTGNIASNSANPSIPIPNINPSSPLANRNVDSADISNINSFANPRNGSSNSASADRNVGTNTSFSLINRNESSADLSSKNANEFANSANVISNSAPKSTNVKESIHISHGNSNEGSTSNDSANTNISGKPANEHSNPSDSYEDDYSEFEKYPTKVTILRSMIDD